MPKAKTASVDFILQASRVMKTLGHPTRLEIGKLLRKGERSVAEIQKHLGMIQPLTSQHLRLMHRRGIVVCRRQGTTCFYSLAGELIFKVLGCLDECERAGIPVAVTGAVAAKSSAGKRRTASK